MLGRDLENPAGIVLRLHLARGLTERACKALCIDRRVADGWELGEQSGRVERVARRGQHPYALLAEAGRRDGIDR